MTKAHIGSVLRDYRNNQHLKVMQVVNLLEKDFDIHISPKTLYSWENGQNQLSACNLLALCRIYNITNMLIVLGYNQEKEPTPLILSAEEREIILKYRSRNYSNSAIRKLLDIE